MQLAKTDQLPDIHIHIEPSRGWISLKLRELWAYRELFYFLTWRDVTVRYKQTVLGAAWAIIQPFFTMVVFSLFFGKLAKMPSDGIPYPIFSYAALVPWTFFANGLTSGTNSLVNSANLIQKVYFPRLVIPISAVLSGVVDFALAFLVLLGMMLFYGIHPTSAIIWLPLFLLLALVTALGVGLWLTALNVQFRDVRYVVPFVVNFWMFASPVALVQPPAGRAMAHALRSQPDGRRTGWLPLGAAGRERCAGTDRVCLLPGGCLDIHQRAVLLPPHGEDVCRCGIMINNGSIRKSGTIWKLGHK